MDKPHKKLVVWQKAVDLSVAVYKVTETFPRHELYGITSQIRRAAVSVPANIAEGSARRGQKELQQFLNIARGSLSELDTHLEISSRIGLIQDEQLSPLQQQMGAVDRLLYGYWKAAR